jgi:glycosyltransferase involved in cell wall biosynthesis
MHRSCRKRKTIFLLSDLLLLPLVLMVVAVNTRFLIKGRLEGYGYYIQELLRIISVKHPEHQFYFLFDRPCDLSFLFNNNVHPVVTGPAARHPLLWKYWYDVSVPAALKKIKADVFLSPDGFCSLNTGVPQCLIVHDLGFLHYPKGYKWSHRVFYKRYTGRFLKKAKSIATVSKTSKEDIVKTYGLPGDKISVVPNAARDIFHPLDWQEKLVIKEKYTEGKEYFIYVGAIHPRKNLVNLLKAFSFFKKRQQSNMKLVLAGRLAWKNDSFLDLLKTYKYRKDVVLTGYLEDKELARLMASAYAMVYPSFFEGFGLPVLEAMKSDVPVLTSKDTSMEEVAGSAALYFDPENIQDMATQLMMIYKDENLRNRLIQNGREAREKYNWERSADLLWEAILLAAGR